MKWLAVALISALLLTMFAVIAFLPSSFFLDEDEWQVYKEVERISFPGGDIVVREIRQTPSDKGYISLSIEANLTSEGNLAAYVESRTNALNALLDSVATNSTIEAVITFKNPINPEDFASLCETSIEKIGEYAIILTNETTDIKSTEVLWFPRPQEAGFIQNLTSIKESSRLEGIMAFECYIKAEAARSLQSDPKVLLVDPLEDPQMLKIKKDYESKGFYVQLGRPFFE
jgi:hypothetical protein